MLTSIAATKAHSTCRRLRASQRSAGAIAANPTSRVGAPGGISITIAGNNVTLNARATTMPRPAITPSSAIPT